MDMDNIKLSFNSDAIHMIATIAASRKVGARALRSIVEALMMGYMFNYPGSTKKSLTITKKDVMTYINEKIPQSERKKLSVTIDNWVMSINQLTETCISLVDIVVFPQTVND